jgi:hypothetical protein
VSSPIVKEGRVIGFTDDWFAQRKWPVDMAGFAVNLNFLRYGTVQYTVPTLDSVSDPH